MPAKVTSPIGPYSKPNTLAKLDGRRREAKLMQAVRTELVDHIGGKPSAVQKRIIDRAAVLALRLDLMDSKAPDGRMSEKDAREYLCWHNAYVRTLKELGIGAAEAKPPSVEEWIASLPRAKPSEGRA